MAESQPTPPLDETGSHPMYIRHEQRRSYPRVRLRIPVQVGLPGGQVACARIYNLSPDGIQIRCDPVAARRIHPSGNPIRDGSGPKVTVAMRLKKGSDVCTLVLRCKVFYLLAETPKEIIIGLEFEELDAAQRDTIDAVMSASLEPAA